MMKDRIQKIMRHENMTQQEFAKAIEVSPASLSNMFNGKTNPTNNQVRAIHRRFPNVNINWLMFGEGNMYENVAPATNNSDGDVDESMVHVPEKDDAESLGQLPLFDNPSPAPQVSPTVHEAPKKADAGQLQMQTVREVVKFIDRPQRKITEIRIFFDDGTFEVFS